MLRYKTKARTVIEEEMEIVLTGLTSISPDEEFTHELVRGEAGKGWQVQEAGWGFRVSCG